MTRYLTILEKSGQWTIINGPNQTRHDQLLTIRANGKRNPTGADKIMLCRLSIDKVARLDRVAKTEQPEPEQSYISKRTKK